jgi:hypothetical protein
MIYSPDTDPAFQVIADPDLDVILKVSQVSTGK